MMFVERDEAGQIVRAYTNPQNFPTDELEDDDVGLLAFLASLEPARRMTSLEFLDLFTEAEQLAVITAAMSNPQINLWWTKLTMATFVDFSDPRLAGGLKALVAAGLLTAERAQEVLA